MKAVRFKANGKYLRNSVFSTPNSDFIGAYHGVPTDAIFNAELAAEEEALSIESWKNDLAIAFGIPAAEIECEVIAWDGDLAHLPAEDEPDARVRIPEEQRAGYVPPPPKVPTLVEKLDAILASLPTDMQAKVTEALKG